MEVLEFLKDRHEQRLNLRSDLKSLITELESVSFGAKKSNKELEIDKSANKEYKINLCIL